MPPVALSRVFQISSGGTAAIRLGAAAGIAGDAVIAHPHLHPARAACKLDDALRRGLDAVRGEPSLDPRAEAAEVLAKALELPSRPVPRDRAPVVELDHDVVRVDGHRRDRRKGYEAGRAWNDTWTAMCALVSARDFAVRVDLGHGRGSITGSGGVSRWVVQLVTWGSWGGGGKLPLGLGALTIVAMATASACTNSAVESNASDPQGTVQGYPASEPSMLFLPGTVRFPEGVTLAAYNDLSAFFLSGSTTVLRDNATAAGLSYSTDGGLHWLRRGPLPPDTGCGASSGNCIVGLDSDPWLAFDGTTAFYSMIGWTKKVEHVGFQDFRYSELALAVATSADGIDWTPFTVAYKVPLTDTMDKPSISAIGETAVAAFVQDTAATNVADQNFSRIRLVASTFIAPFPPGWFSEEVVHESLCAGCSLQNPVIRLTSPTTGFLAYMVLKPIMNSGDDLVDLKILRLTRSINLADPGGFTPWSSVLVYERDNVQIHPLHRANPNGGNGTWRDGIPMSFAVGTNGDHLYIAYTGLRNRPDDDTMVSSAQLDDCPHFGNGGICGVGSDGTTFGWRHWDFYSPFVSEQNNLVPSGDQLQPSVSASRSSEGVVLTWYGQQSDGFSGTVPQADDRRLAVYGIFSNDGLASGPVGPFDILETDPYLPCTTANGYWGDYFGSVVIPGRVFHGTLGFPGGSQNVLNNVPYPWIVTTHTDSRLGCTTANVPVVFDQHLESVVW